MNQFTPYNIHSNIIPPSTPRSSGWSLPFRPIKANAYVIVITKFWKSNDNRYLI